MLAAMGNHVGIVRLLIQSGADLDARAHGITALDMAISHDASGCVAALLEEESIFPPGP
jgi:ankyrin repeat protein